MSFSFDEIKARKKLPVEEVPIVLDGEWGQQVLDAQERMVALESSLRARPGDTTLIGELDELLAEIERLNAERDEHVAVFKFKGLGRDRYERLVRAHPPTQEQRKQAARESSGASWNRDTFPPALIHACLVEPSMTLEQVVELLADDEWNEADAGALFSGASSACLSRTVLR